MTQHDPATSKETYVRSAYFRNLVGALGSCNCRRLAGAWGWGMSRDRYVRGFLSGLTLGLVSGSGLVGFAWFLAGRV